MANRLVTVMTEDIVFPFLSIAGSDTLVSKMDVTQQLFIEWFLIKDRTLNKNIFVNLPPASDTRVVALSIIIRFGHSIVVVVPHSPRNHRPSDGGTTVSTSSRWSSQCLIRLYSPFKYSLWENNDKDDELEFIFVPSSASPPPPTNAASAISSGTEMMRIHPPSAQLLLLTSPAPG